MRYMFLTAMCFSLILSMSPSYAGAMDKTAKVAKLLGLAKLINGMGGKTTKGSKKQAVPQQDNTDKP